MQANIGLGRLFGIPIGLHYSWFVIAGLITVSLGVRFSATNPGEAVGAIWATAIVTAILFFTSLLLHELAHALVADWYGVPFRRRLRSAERFSDAAMARAVPRVKTSRSRSRALLVAVTRPDQRRLCFRLLGLSPRPLRSGRRMGEDRADDHAHTQGKHDDAR